jgi:hypothetical protein
MFRARIGLLVRSGDLVLQARSHDQLNEGDLIRIYVHPEASSFVYVVHTDQQNRKASLLNMTEQKVHSCMLVLPSVAEYYQVDGKSNREVFTIVCSPTQLPELAAGQIDMDYEKWKGLEKTLMERSALQMVETVDRPFPIIGSVRSVDSGPGGPPVPVFTGKGLLVKKYEFEIRKP